MTINDCFSITDEGTLWGGYTVEQRDLFFGEIEIPVQLNGVMVKSISGFSNAPMTSVTIPNGVKIEAQTFKDCKALRNIKLPHPLSDIFPETFSGCENLEVSLLPKPHQHIHEKAFYGCSCIQHIILPASVTEIGSRAFFGCHRDLIINVLSDDLLFRDFSVQKCHIIFLAENYLCQHGKENNSSHPFESGTVLHVPKGSKAVYKERFLNQYEIIEIK